MPYYHNMAIKSDRGRRRGFGTRTLRDSGILGNTVKAKGKREKIAFKEMKVKIKLNNQDRKK